MGDEMSGHIPGPWVVIAQRYVIADPRRNGNIVAVATADVHSFTPDTTQANIRLIAAAPDLLAALLSCVAELEPYADEEMVDEPGSIAATVMAARAAIAKATQP